MPWNRENVPASIRDQYGQDRWRRNRYGEDEWVNPNLPLTDAQSGYILGNPAAWITGGMAGTGMRIGDTGLHRGTLQGYLGDPELLYRVMTGNTDFEQAANDAVSWMNNLITNWAGGVGDNAAAARQAMGNIFNVRDPNLQSDLYDLDANTDEIINLLTGLAFLQAGPQMAERFERELNRKRDDWSRYMPSSLEEIPFLDYLVSENFLGNWGIPGF